MTTENFFKIIDLDSNGPCGIYMVMNPQGLSCLNAYVPEGKEIDENASLGEKGKEGVEEEEECQEGVHTWKGEDEPAQSA